MSPVFSFLRLQAISSRPITLSPPFYGQRQFLSAYCERCGGKPGEIEGRTRPVMLTSVVPRMSLEGSG